MTTQAPRRILPFLPLVAISPAAAQPEAGLAEYFGFDGQRIVVVDDDCGPVARGDLNADGLADLVVANNRKSRIDVYYLRSTPRSDEERQRQLDANELPPSAWYDHERISVPHRVGAIAVHDADGDGAADVIYAGVQPQELVVLRQVSATSFEPSARKRVRGLAGGNDALRVADVMGDDRPEIVGLVDGRINLFPIGDRGTIGDPVAIGAGEGLVAHFVEDFDGDGLFDVLGAVPDDAAPLRLWLQERGPAGGAKQGLLAAELRFEMPQLAEAEPIRFPGRKAASIGVIERASRRMVFFDLVAGGAGGGAGESEVAAEVVAFPGTGVKDRSVTIGDLDGDGRPDLLAADPKGHAVKVYLQRAGAGLVRGEGYASLKSPASIAVGRWESAAPRVFVLSEDEKSVGVSAYAGGRLDFPVPIQIKTPGGAPVAMQAVEINGSPAGAVVVKDRRDLVLELHFPGADGRSDPARVAAMPLAGVTRAPKSILSADPDQDGSTDLLLLAPGEPMVMVHSSPGDAGPTFAVLTDKDMAQFGLVQAAGPTNTAQLDWNGNGRPELLIATANFVRACSYDEARGWSVAGQVNVPDPTTDFAGLTILQAGGETLLVASDKANGRLVIFGRDAAGQWGVRDRIRVTGFTPGQIAAGAFGGDDRPGVLCVGDDGFAFVRLDGQRVALDEFAALRPESEDRIEHEMEAGDLNGDGFVDIAVLDAGEQMCEIYTFSAARRLVAATEFEVFQSRLFQGGQRREYEPSVALVADLTGDKADDLLLLCHDRLLIYPQAAAPAGGGSR